MKKILFLSMMLVSLMACNKNENPLLVEQDTPFGVPAFDKVKIEHYMPAFEQAIAENEAEIAAIVNNPDAPTFANTIEALDRSGELLDKVVGVFFNILEADGNDEMNKIAEEVTPLLSALSDGIILNDALFQRVKAVYEQREELGLNDEQMRLLTETFKSFANNGANLPEDKKERLKVINQELGLLSLQFGNNVVAETNAYELFITDEAELVGLPESAKAAAKEEATAAGRPEAWLFTPKRTSFTPVLQYCENRELRKELLMAYTTRGNHDNENDNKDIIVKTMQLRVEKAQLFGYDNPADYILADCMAKDAKTVDAFLESVWAPSLKAAKREAKELQALLSADLPGEDLQPWDWWYYTEKLRKAKYDLNQNTIKKLYPEDMQLAIDNWIGKGIFYGKVLSAAPGKLVVERIPLGEIQGGATLLKHGQQVKLAANDNRVFCFPKGWSATEFMANTQFIMAMHVSNTPDFQPGDANVLTVYPFSKEDGKRKLQLTSGDISNLGASATNDYLYVRFTCNIATTIFFFINFLLHLSYRPDYYLHLLQL